MSIFRFRLIRTRIAVSAGLCVLATIASISAVAGYTAYGEAYAKAEREAVNSARRMAGGSGAAAADPGGGRTGDHRDEPVMAQGADGWGAFSQGENEQRLPEMGSRCV